MSVQNLFEFLPLPQIYFGRNNLEKIGDVVRNFGEKILIVSSKSVLKNEYISTILESSFTKNNLKFDYHIISGEPEIHIIENGIEKVKREKFSVIIGLGGGSVIDTGKAIASLATNEGKVTDYLEVIGKGLKIKNLSLPFIAAPTTAGTGSEVTKNAVILSREDKLKVSLRSPLLIPKIVIIDPKTMLTLPPNITANCGMDALTQLIESYTSNKAQPITDTLALLGIRKIADSLIKAFEEGNDLQAREDLAFAALLSGICLANAGLGAVHGFAGVIGGMFSAPHGEVCAALLAPVVEENIKQMLKQIPFNPKLEKYVQLSEITTECVFDDIRETVSYFISYLENITKILQIPKLEKFGVSNDDFENVIENATKSSSMKYNPISLDNKHMRNILIKATFSD